MFRPTLKPSPLIGARSSQSHHQTHFVPVGADVKVSLSWSLVVAEFLTG